MRMIGWLALALGLGPQVKPMPPMVKGPIVLGQGTRDWIIKCSEPKRADGIRWLAWASWFG